ncbi:hypothetical protein [Flavobacterium sp.]|uniref:hypothetical protein n=1 Tax=Flavobacterium sp. TaxID=239 RepID=UPI003D6C5A3E
MSQSGYIAIELMINKFSEFIEWLFEGKKKTELGRLTELNSTLINLFNFSIFDVSEKPLAELKVKFEKIDSHRLEDIISSLFNASISKNDNEMFKRLNSNIKLNERIMELILLAEDTFHKLSIESCNIKNSIQHKLYATAG